MLAYNSLLFAAAIFMGHPAALIGNDRVSADYPGFHQIHGDVRALALVGTDEPLPHGGGGLQDGVVIRKLDAKLLPSQFSLQRAIAVTPKWLEFVDSVRVAGGWKVDVCGNPAFGFLTIDDVTIPMYASKPLNSTHIHAHVVAMIGNALWHADYYRLYSPTLEKNGRSLVAFASRFCVQSNYLRHHARLFGGPSTSSG